MTRRGQRNVNGRTGRARLYGGDFDSFRGLHASKLDPPRGQEMKRLRVYPILVVGLCLLAGCGTDPTPTVVPTNTLDAIATKVEQMRLAAAETAMTLTAAHTPTETTRPIAIPTETPSPTPIDTPIAPPDMSPPSATPVPTRSPSPSPAPIATPTSAPIDLGRIVFVSYRHDNMGELYLMFGDLSAFRIPCFPASGGA